MFKEGSIEGVVVRELKRHTDKRGWLCELFRHDELKAEDYPVMSYISMTHPGVARGPHAHREQTDYFAFIGPSTFRVYLWDGREGSTTYMNKMAIDAGHVRPLAVIVPPGVVHAYKNIGDTDGVVFNFPNRLYGGRGRKEEVDEVRYEEDPASIYRMD
jgi:dTDP-4-dehydrorhamnose 3,5-epimerase